MVMFTEGLKKIIEGKTWQKGIYLAERVCGICSYEHTQSLQKLLRESQEFMHL